jgi:hypothetical protein
MRACAVATAFAVMLGGLRIARAQETDGVEFAELNDATAFGWDVTDHTTLSITREARVGEYALQARPAPDAEPYRGINLIRELDLTGAGPQDSLVFHVKQHFGSGMRIQLWTALGQDRAGVIP